MSDTAATAARGGHARDVTRVADGIRDAITAGEYAPDQRLIEADLGARFEASRGTVRAALLLLSGHGLVTRNQNHGSRVRTISLGEAIEITEVRAAIEALCAAKCARRADPILAGELEKIVGLMHVAVTSADVSTYSRLNQLLHERIVDGSGHATAAAELERLDAQIVKRQYRLAMRPGRIERSVGQHQAIVDAIVAGHPGAAARAMRSHLESVIDAMRDADRTDAAVDVAPGRSG